MPFKSSAQKLACYATHGFNGKVNCDEWAHATANIKSLPDKVKEGGTMNYRGCKKCGGKMQEGGRPKQSDYPDYESYAAALDAWNASQQQPSSPSNTIDPFTGQELLPNNMVNVSDNGQWTPTMPSPNYKPPTATQKNINQSLQNLGIGISGALTGLGFLSGAVERNRQNQ